MKVKLVSLVALFLLFAFVVQLALAQEQPKPERKSAVCPRSRLSVQVDGNLDDWKDVDATKGIVLGEADHVHNFQHYRGPEDACAIVYLKWDDEKIYVAAVATDDVARNTNFGPTNNQNGDGFLICFTPKLPPGAAKAKVDYPYAYIITPGDFGEIKPQMQLVKGKEDTLCELAARKTKHGYQLEAAFPLAFLPELRPEIRKTIGFEACQYEGDRIALPTIRTEILAWNSTKDRMDAAECGALTFTGPEGEEIATTPGQVFAEALIKNPFKPSGPYAARSVTDSFDMRGVPLSLYFDRGERAKILAKCSNKEFPVGKMLERMLVVCDSYLETWRPDTYEFKSLTAANAVQVSKVVERLSFAFVLTEEAVYADLARRTMLQMAEKVDNWSSELGSESSVQVAETLSRVLAVGYDWTYNALNDEERKAISNAMVKAGSKIESALSDKERSHARSCSARCALGVLGLATRKQNEKAEGWISLGEQGARDLAKGGWGKTAEEIEESLIQFILFAEPLRRTAGRDLYVEIDLSEPANRLMALRRTKVADGWAIDPLHVSLGTNARAALALKIAGDFADASAMWFYETCFDRFPASPNGADDVYSILWYDRRVKASPPDWFNEKAQAQLLKNLEDQVLTAAKAEAIARSKARTGPKRKTVEEQSKESVPFSAEWLTSVDEKALEDFGVTIKSSLLNRHPRLYFTADDLPLLHARMASTHQRPWLALLEGMEKSITMKYETLRGLSKSEHPTGRGVGDRTAQFGIAYALTRDDAYGELTKRHVLGMCAEFPWEPNETDLVHGHALAGLGIAYDCAYDYLMPEEKALVRDTLIKQTAIMSEGFGYLLKGKSGEEKKRLAEELTKIYADPRRGGTARNWRKPGSANNHSWIQKAGMAIAAAAIYDECPETKNWLKQARWEYEKILQIHGPDGASCEGGGGYWSYGIQWMFRYLELLYHISGENLYGSPWLRNTGYYQLYLTTPDRTHVANFGDNPTSVGRLGFIEYRLASEFRDGYVQWLGDVLTYDERIKDRPGAPFWNILWCDPSVEAKSPDTLPPYRYFDDLEMVTMRSDWSEEAMMVAFRCGPPMGYSVFRHGASGYGHAQPDQNHFTLFADGEFLLTDPGYSRWKMTREHNTILVDGYGQVGEAEHWFHRFLDADQLGRIEEFFGSENYCYVRGNAQPAYHYKKNDPHKTGNVQEPEDLDLSKFLRHVLFVDGKYLVTFDEIETGSERKINWLLHSESPIDIEGEREFTAKQGDARLAIKVVEPDRLEHKVEPMMVRVDVAYRPNGTKDFSETPTQRGYVLDLSPASKTTSVNSLAAYYPHKAGNDRVVPMMRKISGQGWIGIALASDEGLDRILFNTAGREMRANDISTDAARCLVRTHPDGRVKQFVLHDGKELKVGGQILARSSHRVILVSSIEKSVVKCDDAVELEIFAPTRPSNVFANDKGHEIVYNGDTHLLKLQMPKGYSKVEVEF